MGPGVNLGVKKEKSVNDETRLPNVIAPKKTIGIAVAANNLDRETIDEFLKNRQFLSEGDEIYINDKPTLGPYNPARNKNIAIAEAIKAGHDVIVQSDIDMRLSRELIEQTRASVEKGNYVFKYCVNEDGTRRDTGFGAWNALTSDDWVKSGGLDERMFGYGCEDTGFFLRLRDLGWKTIMADGFEPVHLRHRTDRGWLRFDREQRARNAKLMDIPYTKNYLQGRLNGFSDAVKSHVAHMQFYVTSTCQRHCPECSQQHYMKATRGWEATLEDVEFFIRCAEMQGHVFQSVVLSGGDPYLWKPLEAAVRLFKDSSAFRSVTVFTGIINDDLTRRIEGEVDKIVFSDYGTVPGYVPRNMILDHRVREHFVRPSAVVPETLPAVCICQGPRVQGARVYSCSDISDLLLRTGGRLESETYSEPLTSQFLDMYYGLDLFNDPHCAMCVGNGRVQKHCSTIDNTKQKECRVE